MAGIAELSKGQAVTLIPSGSESVTPPTIKNDVLDLGQNPILLIGNRKFVLNSIQSNSDAYRKISLKESSGNTTATKVVFNTVTYTFKAISYNANISENEVLIGACRLSNDGSREYNFPFNVVVDGVGVFNVAFERNKHKAVELSQACRINKTSTGSKDYQILIITDSHGQGLVEKNAVAMTNNFPTIDAMIHCGDIVGGHYVEAQAIAYNERMYNCEKPFFTVVGNHDVGNTRYVAACSNHLQTYNSFIKPMVTKGILKEGEYEEGKSYWYHDDEIYKIRLIGLYEYDSPMDIDSDYWEPISYDSSLPLIKHNNTTYNVGDEINAVVWGYGNSYTNYTEFSFRCKKQCTISGTTFHNALSYLPLYRIPRGTRVIRQEQAQWFLDTLASTPADYTVIVALHNPFSDDAVTIESKFTQVKGVKGSAYSQNSMKTDFIANAVNAFVNGEVYSEKIVMKNEASYLNNILNDDGENYYAYSVFKDFTTKNTGVRFAFFIGGHIHFDLVWKHPNGLYQVSPICSTTEKANSRNNDVARPTNYDDISTDCLTVVSVAKNRMALVKLGCDTTINGKKKRF